MRGRSLDLTYKEFEPAEVPRAAPRPGLHPRPACCRRSGATTTTAAPAPSTSTCGGCALLGAEFEQQIGTVRNVGYRFVAPGREGVGARESQRTS
ncbi:hypothetical protein GCM10025868_28180 [Angustibacter aerolatus]|uniref:OmpR/PhoB-type domain-containing protein n=1 Tax=Angustibacter aerolatus TaxID=1162965 RepID=A0ABQ6JH93_9ACTN|nr:hypothetical protein [Angustibacter aerolatus]GMA87568.1 hypothetical protein GCM10025868_28180 [Angustibacter aerolatus]